MIRSIEVTFASDTGIIRIEVKTLGLIFYTNL